MNKKLAQKRFNQASASLRQALLDIDSARKRRDYWRAVVKAMMERLELVGAGQIEFDFEKEKEDDLPW